MAITIAVLYQRMCGYKDSFISEDDVAIKRIAVLYHRMCGYNDSRFICVALEDVWL